MPIQQYKETKIYISKNGMFCYLPWIYAAILTLYTFMQSVMAIGLPDFIGTAIFFTAIISVNKEDMFFMLAFILPFINAFGINELSLIFVFVYMIRFGIIDVNLSHSILPLLILLSIELSHSLLYGDIIEFFRYGIFLILVMIFIIHFKNYNDQETLAKNLLMFCLASAASMTMVAVSAVNYYGLDTLLLGQLRIGYYSDKANSMLISMNANQVGFICVLTIAILLLLFEKKRITFPLFAIIILDQIVVGMLSVSRTFILILAFVFLYYLLTNIKISLQRRKILIILAVISALVYYLTQTMLSDVIYEIVERFSGADVLTGNDRTTILMDNWEMANRNLIRFLFGYGITTYTFFTNGGAAHNALAEMLVGSGMVGMITFLIWFFNAFLVITQKTDEVIKRTATNYLPLLIFILFTQTIQFLSQYYSILIFMYMITAVNIGSKYELPRCVSSKKHLKVRSKFDEK